jgi:hypothetical protein
MIFINKSMDFENLRKYEFLNQFQINIKNISNQNR